MIYLFIVVVGQDEVRFVLLLCVVNLCIGGVIFSGEKGMVKLIVVCGFVELLFGYIMCILVLGIIEDCFVGGLDLEVILVVGCFVFQLGLFSEVDGGVFYIDEVNFFDDYFVDFVIDVCVGIVWVECEGLMVFLLS